MNPEERALLERILKLSEENNQILHKMQRSMRLARIMSLVYWIFIIGSAIGAYYLIQPYLEQLMNVYSGAKSNIDSFSSLFK
jgi:hypothetical protein